MRITGNINLRYIMEDMDFAKISGKVVTLSYFGNGNTVSQTYTASSPTVVNLDLANCEIEWIKLELGESATPFISMPISHEILLCLRYYNKLSAFSIPAVVTSANQVSMASISFPNMRTNPTATFKDVVMTTTASGVTQSGFTFGGGSSCNSYSAIAIKTSHGFTSTQVMMHSAAGHIALDAEL